MAGLGGNDIGSDYPFYNVDGANSANNYYSRSANNIVDHQTTDGIGIPPYRGLAYEFRTDDTNMVSYVRMLHGALSWLANMFRNRLEIQQAIM